MCCDKSPAECTHSMNFTQSEYYMLPLRNNKECWHFPGIKKIPMALQVFFYHCQILQTSDNKPKCWGLNRIIPFLQGFYSIKSIFYMITVIGFHEHTQENSINVWLHHGDKTKSLDNLSDHRCIIYTGDKHNCWYCSKRKVIQPMVCAGASCLFQGHLHPFSIESSQWISSCK